MSKEKTRAELHAEVADLKAKVAEAINNLQGVIISRDELKEKYDALEKEASELRSEVALLKCNQSINHEQFEKKCAEIKRLKDERDTAKCELNCEREAWEKKEQGFQKLIADGGKYQDELKADLDKAQYIAADLLEHGVFHFLIVKYRNLKSK